MIRAAFSHFQRTHTPIAAGNTVMTREMNMFLKGTCRVSLVQLRLYSQMFKGMIPNASTLDKIVMVKLKDNR